MFKGQLYETIVTTQNGELVKNAAPIGVICKDSNHVVIHLDNCVHTHLNILENGELIVNITKNPLVFTYSTLGELDDEGGPGADVALEEAHGLLEVVDVVGADRVFAVGVREELLGGDDHGRYSFGLLGGGRAPGGPRGGRRTTGAEGSPKDSESQAV